MAQFSYMLNLLREIKIVAESGDWDLVKQRMVAWEQFAEEQGVAPGISPLDDEDEIELKELRLVHQGLQELAKEKHRILQAELATTIRGDKASLAYQKGTR